jgi:hypothetical protein
MRLVMKWADAQAADDSRDRVPRHLDQFAILGCGFALRGHGGHEVSSGDGRLQAAIAMIGGTGSFGGYYCEFQVSSSRPCGD